MNEPSAHEQIWENITIGIVIALPIVLALTLWK